MKPIMPAKKILVDEIFKVPANTTVPAEYRKYVTQELKSVGADWYDLQLPETHILPLLIQPYEQIEGVVYGKYSLKEVGRRPIIGRGALVATNKRILFIDKKPLFIHCNEIPYERVSGLNYGHVAFASNLKLISRNGNITMRTFNQHTISKLVEAIEAHLYQVKAFNPVWK